MCMCFVCVYSVCAYVYGYVHVCAGLYRDPAPQGILCKQFSFSFFPNSFILKCALFFETPKQKGEGRHILPL